MEMRTGGPGGGRRSIGMRIPLPPSPPVPPDLAPQTRHPPHQGIFMGRVNLPEARAREGRVGAAESMMIFVGFQRNARTKGMSGPPSRPRAHLMDAFFSLSLSLSPGARRPVCFELATFCRAQLFFSFSFLT